MNTEDLRTLYAYNRWANERVCDAARQLETGGKVHPSRSSVRDTLVHILWGEWLWLQRWRGESPMIMFNPNDFPDVTAMEAGWDAVWREQQQFIERLTDQELRARVSYENLQGQRWEYTRGEMMQHVVNHSSYHRGQVALLLRQLGSVATATDFLMFLDETGLKSSEPGASGNT